jgi:hypothetical protein
MPDRWAMLSGGNGSLGELTEYLMGFVAALRADNKSVPTILNAAACMVAVIALGLAGRAQAQAPQVDIENTCKSAAAAMVQLMGGSTSQRDYEVCLTSEQKAREQIGKDWSTYAADDRTQCLQPYVYLPSYIEWLTCLEMARDVRKLKGIEPAPDPMAPVTLPVLPPSFNDARIEPGPSTPITLPVVLPGINDAVITPGPITVITMPKVRWGIR